MSALAFAWRSLVRQPARALLGTLGVAAVGALLFDMLLLSQGLVSSMRDLLDQGGFDIRVTASGDPPREGPPIRDAVSMVQAIEQLPAIRAAVAIRFVEGDVERGTSATADSPSNSSNSSSPSASSTLSGSSNSAAPSSSSASSNAAGDPTESSSLSIDIQGVTQGSMRPWTLVTGQQPESADTVVVNEALASATGAVVGSHIVVRAACQRGREALPTAAVVVSGIATFPFEAPGARTVAGSLEAVNRLCGDRTSGDADMILVASRASVPIDAGDIEAATVGDLAIDSSRAAAAAIEALGRGVRAVTNAEVVARLQESSFTYFQQISSVLTAVTTSFALLLISVLLTVSVNQRLGEIAALRAIGFSARRVVADILAESALIVGLGGVLSLPLGLVLAQWLDDILKDMPGIPSGMHFFVFEIDALLVHLALLVMTALVAALYPMHLVSRLPISATLRAEIVS